MLREAQAGPRILFVTGEYPPDVGGVGDYTAQLADALLLSGTRVRILTHRLPRWSQPLRPAHVSFAVHRWGLGALAQIARRAPSGAVVHLQYQAGAFALQGDLCLAPLLLRRLRSDLQFVTTFHDLRAPYIFPKARPLRAGAVRILARFSNALIAADPDDVTMLRRVTARVHQIPIGSNIPCAPPAGYDRAAYRRKLGALPDEPLFVYFGFLSSTKGLPILAGTFQRILALQPSARLLLLGAAVGRSDEYDRRAARKPLVSFDRVRSRVKVTGYLAPPDLSAHLLAADVALLPYSDGASLRRGSLLACAAHGLPVVTTSLTVRHGGLAEVPLVGAPGSLVLAGAPDDDVSLAAAALAVAERKDLRTRLRLGSAALTRATAWSLIAERHLQVYARLRRQRAAEPILPEC